MITKAQQSALDNALVAPENQRVIGECNMRINPGMKPKEPTYQVVLDTLALTSCYLAFLIIAEVPINNKRFSVNVEVFKDILNICLRVPGQEFDEPPSEEEALSFIRELGHSGEIKYITDVIVDHLHQPWRTFASIINKCLCGKPSHLRKLPPRRSLLKIRNMHLPKKKLAFKPKPTKKKAPVKDDRGKGLNVLTEIALSKDAQLKEAIKQSKKDFHISQVSGSGTSAKLGVPDVPKYDFESDKGSWGDSREEDNDDKDDTKDDEGNDDGDDIDGNDDDDDDDDDGDDDDDSDHERTESDKDENPNLN
ncbi:retrovirus-related pol polyprotein from transposon TNT 1-94 [Tanacetum coccineum]|uniref:Retrovirus-related pol polyprotein from transposon TNT 1-94 n=1 Tax=Tanacetum coccineum TaxID=301880 RepID=A0ABQ5CRK4_9ASTR